MKLSEILSEDRILVPLEAETLEEAIGLLCHGLETSGTLPKGAGTHLAGEFFSGARGEVIRVNEWVILAAARSERVERFTGTLGLALVPFDMGGEGEGGTASVLLLLLTPRRVSPLKLQAIPALSRFLRDKKHAARLKRSRTPSEISGFSAFMDVEVQDQLLVADGLSPLQFRVYADTPLAEVVGLMVRQGLRAVPVVGQKLEFLGLITSGDAIRYLLPERLTGAKTGKEMGSLLAREVMIRSIMCISEEQSLVEAANLMVNKGVSQLPVVRGGELVGFLTVDTALHLLLGPGRKTASDATPESFRLPGG
jgi:CBS domain-containing protein/mannitol/fructose-specific phosphotransferase system IIA component (Ntr-type)